MLEGFWATWFAMKPEWVPGLACPLPCFPQVSSLSLQSQLAQLYIGAIGPLISGPLNTNVFLGGGYQLLGLGVVAYSF